MMISHHLDPHPKALELGCSCLHNQKPGGIEFQFPNTHTHTNMMFGNNIHLLTNKYYEQDSMESTGTTQTLGGGRNGHLPTLRSGVDKDFRS